MKNTDALEVKRATVFATLGKDWKADGPHHVAHESLLQADPVIPSRPMTDNAGTQDLRVDIRDIDTASFVARMSSPYDTVRGSALLTLVQGCKGEDARDGLAEAFNNIASGLTAAQAVDPKARAAFNAEAERIDTILNRAGVDRFLSPDEVADAKTAQARVAGNKKKIAAALIRNT